MCQSIHRSDYLEGDGPGALPTMLPSPEKLKYKVLAKNRKLTEKNVGVTMHRMMAHQHVRMAGRRGR